MSELHPKPDSQADEHELLAGIYLSLWKCLARKFGELAGLEQLGRSVSDEELWHHVEDRIQRAKVSLAGKTSEIRAIYEARERTREFLAALSKSHDLQRASERGELREFMDSLRETGLGHEVAADKDMTEVAAWGHGF